MAPGIETIEKTAQAFGVDSLTVEELLALLSNHGSVMLWSDKQNKSVWRCTLRIPSNENVKTEVDSKSYNLSPLDAARSCYEIYLSVKGKVIV